MKDVRWRFEVLAAVPLAGGPLFAPSRKIVLSRQRQAVSLELKTCGSLEHFVDDFEYCGCFRGLDAMLPFFVTGGP